MIFSSLPFSLSLTPLQFSPDRFHSVLEGMDLIALWGLVGCAGLGCLISVPCRDWFNASWSWNCLIVQPSGDSLCLRRPAGLAKHCSRLLLYAAGRGACLRKWNLVEVGGWGGQPAQQTRGQTNEVDSFSEYLTVGYLYRPHRDVCPYNIPQHDATWKSSNWLLMQYQYLDCDSVFLYEKQAWFVAATKQNSSLWTWLSAWPTRLTPIYLNVWMDALYFPANPSLCMFSPPVQNEWRSPPWRGHANHLVWTSELCAWSPWVSGAGEITFVETGAGCVCVPSVAFHWMPLVLFNHGSDVDLNSKCAWHQILDKGSAVQHR